MDGVRTYLQWHICHLVASLFYRYLESSNAGFGEHKESRSTHGNRTKASQSR